MSRIYGAQDQAIAKLAVSSFGCRKFPTLLIAWQTQFAFASTIDHAYGQLHETISDYAERVRNIITSTNRAETASHAKAIVIL